MFGKLRNSIVGKIIAGYVLIICLAFVTTLVSMYTAYKNSKIDKLVSEAYYPTVLSLKETEILLSDSYKLTNNWIYQPSVKEKEKLKLLHSTELARQNERLLEIAHRFEDDSAKVKTAALLHSVDGLINEEKVVMQKLGGDESYSDDAIVDEAIAAMDKKITPSFNVLSKQINHSLKEQNQLLDEAQAEKETASAMLTYLYVGNLVLFVIIGIYATYLSMNSVTRPIAALSDLILKLSKGKIVSVKLKKSRDEVGQMGEAIENMLTGLKKKIEFAETIGNGNYNSQFELLSEEDGMGEALMQMRNNLSKAAEEDRKRNWATEGLAKFADILRSRNNSLEELSDSIIRNLVKYMNANQGGLFLLNDDNKNYSFLELMGCYAYDRKKHLKTRVEIGQGITGQAVLEKGTIYMTDIPKDYLRITSGLGEALPRNLLIVPLKLDETVFGVVELASFEPIESYKIDFVERLGESIASTISTVKVSERTKSLLTESQQQAEEMRAQEEEMRQNMEELSATQEDMQRVLREVQDKEGYVNEVLNASKDSIFTVDSDFKLISWNKSFASGLEVLGAKVDKGFEILTIFSYDQKKVGEQRSYYTRALNGESFEVTENFMMNGTMAYFSSNYSPIRRQTGEIFAIAVYGRDVTVLTNALHNANKLAEEAQQQAEEVKAQEEELRQNMEELSATQEDMQRVLFETQNKEQYLNELINVSTDAIFTLSKNFEVLNFNGYFSERMKAMGVEMKKGFVFLNLFQGEEREKHKANYQRALNGESFEVTNHSFINGHELYLTSSYAPMRDSTGEITAMACFTKDISALMNAQNQAVDQQRYYNDIIEGMSDCVVTVDKDYTIIVANKAFKDLFSKYDVPVEPGSSLLAMAKGDKAKEEQFKKPYIRAFGGEHVEDPHRHHFDRDFQVTYNPLKNAKGDIIGVSLIAHDITQRLQLMKEAEL